MRRRWLGLGLVVAACVDRGSVFERPAVVGVGGGGGSPQTTGGGGVGGEGGAGGTPVALIDDVSAGPYHTCAIVEGALFCWGRNDRGALGQGDTTGRNLPARVGTDTDWREVVAGHFHTCALRLGGSVWCWGAADKGQVGDGALTDHLEPTFISTVAPVDRISATYDHTVAVLDDGSLWGWGWNQEGQLGQGDPFPGDGVDRPSPVRIGDRDDWTQAGVADGHSCAIASGELWCVGRNSENQLGLGAGFVGQIRTLQRLGTATNWLEVRGSTAHTCAIRTDGTLWCWGDTAEGRLGLGLDVDADVPTQVGSDSDWSTLSVDTFHSCALKRDGSLWCWGRNVEGQLCLGDFDARPTPTQVGVGTDFVTVTNGRFHTCVKRADEAVACCGQNNYGQLGQGDFETLPVLTDVALGP